LRGAFVIIRQLLHERRHHLPIHAMSHIATRPHSAVHGAQWGYIYDGAAPDHVHGRLLCKTRDPRVTPVFQRGGMCSCHHDVGGEFALAVVFLTFFVEARQYASALLTVLPRTGALVVMPHLRIEQITADGPNIHVHEY
jgi:hypothetical protein